MINDQYDPQHLQAMHCDKREQAALNHQDYSATTRWENTSALSHLNSPSSPRKLSKIWPYYVRPGMLSVGLGWLSAALFVNNLVDTLNGKGGCQLHIITQLSSGLTHPQSRILCFLKIFICQGWKFQSSFSGSGGTVFPWGDGLIQLLIKNCQWPWCAAIVLFWTIEYPPSVEGVSLKIKKYRIDLPLESRILT